MRELAANAGLKKIPKGEGINTMHGCRRNNGSRSARITDISDVAKRSGTGHNSIEGFDIYSTVDLESKAKLSAGIQGNGAAAALKSALAKRSALEEQSPHTEIKKRPLEERSSNTTSEMGHSRKKKRHSSTGFGTKAMDQMMKMMQMQMMQKMMKQCAKMSSGKSSKCKRKTKTVSSDDEDTENSGKSDSDSESESGDGCDSTSESEV